LQVQTYAAYKHVANLLEQAHKLIASWKHPDREGNANSKEASDAVNRLTFFGQMPWKLRYFRRCQEFFIGNKPYFYVLFYCIENKIFRQHFFAVKIKKFLIF
jgi:hypothetical protein